ncbi:uncharacterized protein A4U43_C03F18010 [Asparagus officinalis]|uniref:protein-serine/threonine phosphatase n=1 Tax=Asparagus officinalis TaxID=4686 RepID=A0A5P1FBX7_ASPOF|nr:uncharacterized protein A4U43_C03F18010 [Asparagus officinalis]
MPAVLASSFAFVSGSVMAVCCCDGPAVWSPYITCHPFLYHHELGSRDRFLILSSDGLYQYFTNEEVVAEVESFIATMPEGDPAQHLVEEFIFRAARKAGVIAFVFQGQIGILAMVAELQLLSFRAQATRKPICNF